MIIEKEGYAKARASLMAQQEKNLPAMQKTQEMWVRSLGQEGPLEEKNSNPLQYSCLDGLQFKGLQRVRHDWRIKHACSGALSLHRRDCWAYKVWFDLVWFWKHGVQGLHLFRGVGRLTSYVEAWLPVWGCWLVAWLYLRCIYWHGSLGDWLSVARVDTDWLVCKSVFKLLIHWLIRWLLVIMAMEQYIFSKMCGNIFDLIVELTQMSFEGTALYNQKNRQGNSLPKETANNLHKLGF